MNDIVLFFCLLVYAGPVVEVDEVDDTFFDNWEEDDGGLTDQEVPVSRHQFMKIKNDVQKQSQDSQAKDQAAREKWKMEQLTEKSEGSKKCL